MSVCVRVCERVCVSGKREKEKAMYYLKPISWRERERERERMTECLCEHSCTSCCRMMRHKQTQQKKNNKNWQTFHTQTDRQTQQMNKHLDRQSMNRPQTH